MESSGIGEEERQEKPLRYHNESVKSQEKIRVALIGVGSFGHNHLRVVQQLPQAVLTAVVDSNRQTAQAVAAETGCRAAEDISSLQGIVDAAIIATPTTTHADIGCELMAAGIDVLIEKPIAATIADAHRLTEAAATHGRILQVGHLERFNPAVEVLESAITHPLFFEIHRLSVFTPRSLDVDVVLDLMIHDLEIVLALTKSMPEEIRAAGIQILSGRVDIANVRLLFPGGCVANLTASRASTERVRKLRVFQPHEYLSLDYSRQEVFRVQVSPEKQISFQPVAVGKDEPLKREVASFLECVTTRAKPRVSGIEAAQSLEVALAILDKIEEHAQVVTRGLARR